MKTSLAIFLLFIFSLPLFPGEKEETVKAPNIEIAQWMQGEIKAEKGKTFYEGKTLVLEFWATWCGPCRRIIPHMNELVEKFACDSVVFLSLTSEKKDVVKKFMEKHLMKARVALDNNGSTFEAYGISGIPQMFLIDKKGNIQWGGHPAMFSEEALKKFLSTGNIDLPEE
jgi:thiol-disulfide isomerase/thioredoxin